MLKKIVKIVGKNKHQIEGYRYQVDQVTPELIAGWAFKVDNNAHYCAIEIRSENVILHACKANIFRADLKEAEIGDGKHAFSIKTAQLVLEKDIEFIDIFIDGKKANEKPLPLSLKLLAKPAPKAAPKPVPKENKPTAKHTDFQMYIDGATSEKVFGWVKRKDSNTHRCKVKLRIGEVVLGSDTADSFRQSIKNAKIGDGCYCFKISPLIHMFPKTKFTCDLYADGVKLTTKSISLEVDPKVLEKAKFEFEFSSQLTEFNYSVTEELKRLASEVNEDGSNTMQVAMNNIATLSARIGVIERVLTKHFATK